MNAQPNAERVANARRVVIDALGRHPGRITLASSFGGPGGMVLVDLISKIDRTVPLYFLDTGLLFDETYDLVERVRVRYGIAPVAVLPEFTVAEQNERFGDALWAMDPDACCALRKLEPQRRYLADFDAWISGVRREQAQSREAIPFVSRDEEGKIRIAPLADWSLGDVLAYVAENDVPYNALNDRGFPSVGCTHCTRAVLPGEDPRAARWPGFAKTECGLHPRSSEGVGTT